MLVLNLQVTVPRCCDITMYVSNKCGMYMAHYALHVIYHILMLMCYNTCVDRWNSRHALSLQALNAKQAAKHSSEVEELLLELSKQNEAAQAAQTLKPQPNLLTSEDPSSHSTAQAATLEAAAGEKSGEGQVANRLTLSMGRDKPANQQEEDGYNQTPPRLTTPNSPARRPNR